MTEARVDYDVRDGMARLILNQPGKLNAMSYDMWKGLAAAAERAKKDPQVRAIVVEGAGERAFCSGADISQFDDRRGDQDAARLYEQAVNEGMSSLCSGDKPTLALIRGICFGGGLAIALSCDLRLAKTGARFCLPAAKLGLGYGYSGVEAMVRRLGFGAAADIFYSARTFDAPEAQRLGVATHVWSADTFEAEAAAYLARIAANAPLTLNAIAHSLHDLQRSESDRDPEAAHKAVARCFASEDYAEGRRAFAEKRAPSFKGV